MDQRSFTRFRRGFPSTPHDPTWPQVPHEVIKMRRHVDILIDTLHQRDHKIQTLESCLKAKQQQLTHVEEELKVKLTKLEKDRKMKDEQQNPDTTKGEELQRKAGLLETGELNQSDGFSDSAALHQKNLDLQRELNQMKEELTKRDEVISELQMKNESVSESFLLTSEVLAEKHLQDIEKEEASRAEISALEEKLEQEVKERKSLQKEKEVLEADKNILLAEKIQLKEANRVLEEKINSRKKFSLWKLMFKQTKSKSAKKSRETVEEAKTVLVQETRPLETSRTTTDQISASLEGTDLDNTATKKATETNQNSDMIPEAED